MIRINLLPFRTTRKKENIRRQVSIFLLSLVLAAIGMFGINMLLDRQLDDLNARIKTTQAELAKYEQINREIEEIKKNLDSLNKKLTVIRELETSRYEPVRLLDTLTQVIIEKRMWITSVDAKSDHVTLAGMAMDDKTVADFMLRLERCSLFSSVNLKTLKQVDKTRKHIQLEQKLKLIQEMNDLRNKPELTVEETEKLKNIEAEVFILKNFEINCKKKPLQQAQAPGLALAGAKKQ